MSWFGGDEDGSKASAAIKDFCQTIRFEASRSVKEAKRREKRKGVETCPNGRSLRECNAIWWGFMKGLTDVFEREDPRTMGGLVETMTRESDKHVQRMKNLHQVKQQRVATGNKGTASTSCNL